MAKIRILAVLTVLLLSACGQKGALILQDDAAKPSQSEPSNPESSQTTKKDNH